MAYCTNCGQKLPEDAMFCPNCGVRQLKGTTGAEHSEDVRDAFAKMSSEMEKAFTLAVKEIQEAFQKARVNMQKTVFQEQITCLNCGVKNPSSNIYCGNCGTKLPAKPETEKQ